MSIKDIIIVTLGFVKIGRMVEMCKCKGQTHKGARTPW